MPYDAGQMERLSEVSKLAGTLAEELLAQGAAGEPPQDKIDALGKAALLLQDFEQPIPDHVADLLIRAHGEQPGEDGANDDATRTVPADDDPSSDRRTTGRRGFLPRLMSSLRSSTSAQLGYRGPPDRQAGRRSKR